MSKESDYLAELQQLDSAQGMVKLRTLIVEFHKTLKRLPKLKAEAEAMLTPQTGVNYDELAARLEARLANAADLLLKYDLLSDDIRKEPEFARLWKTANASMTLRTTDKLLAELEKKEKAAKERIQDIIGQTEKKSKEEAEKIRKAEKDATLRAAGEEARKKLGFIIKKDGTVSDTETGLMWAAQDSGSGLSWQDAKSYCDNYRGGGFSDWQLPPLSALRGLYQSGVRYSQEKPIKIDSWCWSSETRGSEAAPFSFITGIRYWSYQSHPQGRALPMRSGK